MRFSVTSETAKKISRNAKTITTYTINVKHIDENVYEYAVVLSKKQGSAVKRNKIKRKIREIMRLNQGRFPLGQYMIYVNGKCENLNNNLIINDLENAISQLIKINENKRSK